MRNLWIRFGCFLIGYNYNLIKNCSEVAAKTVKRYTSAMLIIGILWAFVGYTFSERYLKLGEIGSIIGAIIFVVIIIQIERQIILSFNPNKYLFRFRYGIAFIMAIIGAVIIDQIIFKEDIEIAKKEAIAQRVDDLMKIKTKELNEQIAQLDSAITQKETELSELLHDVEKQPTIKSYSTQTQFRSERVTIIDSITGKPVVTEKTIPVNITTSSNVENPKIAMIAPLQETINELRRERIAKTSTLIELRPNLEREYAQFNGFIDELIVMFKILTGSIPALIIWFLWFLLLLAIELFIVQSKKHEEETDYGTVIKHQMELRKKKLNLLARKYLDSSDFSDTKSKYTGINSLSNI